jgi:phage terminase Nu1 subunit (DNA packaging protein)
LKKQSAGRREKKVFVTQEQFGKLWRLSQSRVAQFLSRGILRKNGTLEEWDADLREYYSEQIAQHKSEDGIDRVREAALLDRSKRALIDLELAQKHQELWPVKAIAMVLHQHNVNAKNRGLALPNRFKSFCPHIAPRDIDILDKLIREDLTEQAHEQLPPDIRRMVQRYFEELHAADSEVERDEGGDPDHGRTGTEA